MDFSHILPSKKSRLSAVFAFFIAILSLQAKAQAPDTARMNTADRPQKELRKDEKAFDTGSFILHHIADAHEFHFWGDGENSVGLPLPVILWTNNGLVTFMSSAFHHDDEGRTVVERN